MKTILKRMIFWFSVVFLLHSCEELTVTKYEDDPRLYFFRGNYNYGEFMQMSDSVSHSFFLCPDTQERDTVLIDVRTMGLPAKEPRPFKIVQSNAGQPGAAVAGQHYVGFDDVSMASVMMIPGGTVRYLLPVVLLRDPSLNREKVRIEMTVVENDYFGVGIDTLSRFKVTTTTMPEKPENWDRWRISFGDWGAKKMWFVIKYVGITDFNNISNDLGYAFFLQTKAKQALIDYNKDERNPDRPLTEADGTEVKF